MTVSGEVLSYVVILLLASLKIVKHLLVWYDAQNSAWMMEPIVVSPSSVDPKVVFLLIDSWRYHRHMYKLDNVNIFIVSTLKCNINSSDDLSVV